MMEKNFISPLVETLGKPVVCQSPAVTEKSGDIKRIEKLLKELLDERRNANKQVEVDDCNCGV